MESTKSDVQENKKNLISAKKDSKAAKALMIVLLAFFFFVHTSLCYDLLVKFLLRL